MNIARPHIEAVLNKLGKSELVQIILNTEANLGSQIAKVTTEVKDLLAHSKNLEADVAIVRNVNSKLAERVVTTERLYSRSDTVEVVGIPMFIRDNALEQKVCDVFQEIGVDICDRDIQACHCLKDKDRTIVKFTNRRDCLRILRVKRHQSTSTLYNKWFNSFTN